MITRGVLLSLLVTLGLSLESFATRADEGGFDGIYVGLIGMQLDTPKGKNLDYEASAKLVVLPDGNGAILTAQHPDGVVSVAMRGATKGNVFLSDSKGKLDYGGYHYAMRWDITFDARRGTAVIHGKAVNRPKWAKDDDLRYTFRKQAVRKR